MSPDCPTPPNTLDSEEHAGVLYGTPMAVAYMIIRLGMLKSNMPDPLRCYSGQGEGNGMTLDIPIHARNMPVCPLLSKTAQEPMRFTNEHLILRDWGLYRGNNAPCCCMPWPKPYQDRKCRLSHTQELGLQDQPKDQAMGSLLQVFWSCSLLHPYWDKCLIYKLAPVPCPNSPSFSLGCT